MEREKNISILKKHLNIIFEEESEKCQKTPAFFIFDKPSFLEHSPKFEEIKNKYTLVRNNNLLNKISKTLGKINIFKIRYFANTNGFTDGKQITVLLHENDLSEYFDVNLFFIIKTLYHEFKHVFQKEKIKNKSILNDYVTDFDTFRLLIEAGCRKEIPFSYKIKYSNFYSEIDANLYGGMMAEQYCQENGLYYFDDMVYENFKLLNYDFDSFLKMFNLIYRDPIYRISNKSSDQSTYKIFYDGIGNFKRLSEIIKNPLFFRLDEKLKFEMLTSISFLSSVNYDLNLMEKKYICDLVKIKIKQKIDNYLTVREYFSDYKIADHAYLSSGLNMLTQIQYLIEFYLNTMGISYNKDECMNDINYFISFISDYSAYETNGNRFHMCFNVEHFFNEDIRKKIYILDYHLSNNNDSDNYIEMLSAVLLLNDTFKKAIDVTTESMDAEYEQVTSEHKSKR